MQEGSEKQVSDGMWLQMVENYEKELEYGSNDSGAADPGTTYFENLNINLFYCLYQTLTPKHTSNMMALTMWT